MSKELLKQSYDMLGSVENESEYCPLCKEEVWGDLGPNHAPDCELLLLKLALKKTYSR